MISERFVQLLIVLSGLALIFPNCYGDVGLPLIQISHDDDDFGDDYPELREEVHLEDFFWTGSGDGPPDYLKQVHTGISKGKDVVVKTETVVATVYVDGNNEVDIPICLDCYGEGTVGIDGTWTAAGMPPLNFSATDRRYWLLTVMSGFYTQKDNPMLEEKLARLYRLAFTRQQTKHLGINGAQQISGISLTAGRDRRHNKELDDADNVLTTTKDPSDYDVELLDMATNNTPRNKHHLTSSSTYPINTKSELITSSEENITETTTPGYQYTEADMQAESPDVTAHATTQASWELIQENAPKSEKQMMESLVQPPTVRVLQPQSKPNPTQSPPSLLPPLSIRDNQVRVVIHNITQLTEDDVERSNADGDGGAAFGTSGIYDGDISDKTDERPIANQTELIYSVFVNGRPVLAVTAANDMKLVSEAEVATVMGKEIFMKAEPYMREPQATPLAPATHSGSVGFIDSIQNNTVLIVVSSIAIVLLFLLLIALLLMGRSHVRHKNQDINRTTSRNELISEVHSVRPTSTTTVPDTGRTTAESRDGGIQNFSFENENGRANREPRIHFPGPPTTQSTRRSSITSTDNTSDSSVYCPINPPAADVQRILDEKSSGMFERNKARRQNQYDRAEQNEEAVYTTVISEKKRDKSRHKPKRRYISENRVGSLETSPVQSQREYSGDEARSPDLERTYVNFERPNVEAFNPHNNYHRNKLLHQKTIYTDREGLEQQISNEAVNKEIIRALQPTEKSSDSGSIGSFLSMQSVKAFPKTALPEPLNRVLEPVFVTYYDNVENVQQPSSKTSRAQHKRRSNRDGLDATTIATIEGFPTPKAPQKVPRFASQSDNPDPGVVGPIVWERHKKRLSADDLLDNDYEEGDAAARSQRNFDYYSPSRDPAAMRNHYEGLLEGAIQMYSSQDDLPMPLPNRDFTSNRKPTKRELRGSSAGASNNFKSQTCDNRPSTAQPAKTSKSNHSTQPPSPTVGAWDGSSSYGSHSPLVRPMSAGPFHRPVEFQAQNPSSRHVQDLSTAPLIEAIQNELRKFQKESN
ncbi:uncharacterized protein LOC106087194 isoform X2 [Stomoxys calcitrans]|uniref:Uncharacterized protein n=1 Tax=Stomoxys calcitrans TaxID=35570 RepID=A0A1I8NTX0_STOCA|nr:uncharacterized protein LOC106087194 isoform X2 [Stomoxys calcitrans]